MSMLYDALHEDPSKATSLVRKLLNEGVVVNEEFSEKCLSPPLHAAAARQLPEVVELLLDKGASINAPNVFKMPPLMLAVTHGQLANCRLLLERGADPNIRECKGNSMLALAVSNKRRAILKLLLQYGVDINTVNPSGATVLEEAIMIDHRDVISSGGVEMIRVIDSFSTTKLKIMRSLIDYGIDIERRSVDGATVLHTAAYVGDIETVKILLEAGADPNVVDDCNRKPLWPAVRQNNVDIVLLLLEKTTDIDDPVYNGHTCLSTAARWGHQKCVELLLKAGASIWSRKPGPLFLEPGWRLPCYSCDALYWAAKGEGQHHDVVRLILEVGAQRQPERTGDGEYAEWLEIWDRAEMPELERFKKWLNYRTSLSNTPEHEALRSEMSRRVYAMEEEKRQKIGEKIGLSCEREEGNVEQQEQVGFDEAEEENRDEEEEDGNKGG